MNIVRGVADLIRRASGGHSNGLEFGSKADAIFKPSTTIHFSDFGAEALLDTLWKKYINAADKVEKQRLLRIFLEQFVSAFKSWEPSYSLSFPDTAFSSVEGPRHVPHLDNVIIGCSAGHPAEIIPVLINEVARLIELVSEINMDVRHTNSKLSTIPWSTRITTIEFIVLESFIILTRSVYNCQNFVCCNGIQKLIALLKASIIELKTIIGTLPAVEVSSTLTEKIKILQKLLLYIVSIVFSFINKKTSLNMKFNFNIFMDLSSHKGNFSYLDHSYYPDRSDHEARLQWHQEAVVTVMEAGGLNWFVELCRIIRRLNTKDQNIDSSLQYFMLNSLIFMLYENTRAQNLFRSIGGLEVLLDCIELLPDKAPLITSSISDDGNNRVGCLMIPFELHVLSIAVLREAVFGNLNNLQFLCENGRVQRFASGFYSSSFMLLEESKGHEYDFLKKADIHAQIFNYDENNNNVTADPVSALRSPPVSMTSSKFWIDYAHNLSRVLCSFLVWEDTQSGVSISPLYTDLSVRWVMRVLLSVFSCIKSCSNQYIIPGYLRAFIDIIQHTVFYTFKNILVSSPTLIEVFREEGIWEIFLSEIFLWTSVEVTPECFTPDKLFQSKRDISFPTPICFNESDFEVGVFQKDVISFVEYGATLDCGRHNLPECSSLLDIVEQYTCDPIIVCLVAGSLSSILEKSHEKTVVSFKSINAIPRILKAASIQVKELKQTEHGHYSSECWIKSIKACMELFSAYFSAENEAKIIILQSSESLDYLFDLFWEKELRNAVLSHIIFLIKMIPLLEVSRKHKLHLCSKYVEIFTQLREREKEFSVISVTLMAGLRDILLTDQKYYQTLFCEGECFLHIISLLNGNLDFEDGETLVLDVLQTVVCLLSQNDGSKACFRSLVGKNYKALQCLLLNFCQWHPSDGILRALLDMLVDGKFDAKYNTVIKNEDAIVLYLSVLQKCSEYLQCHGLNLFHQLLRDSISNRDLCVRAGMLDFLLDWFSTEGSESVILQVAQLVQTVGGHSIHGRDIRKIFFLLRSDKVVAWKEKCLLLLSGISSMLNEKGPTAFFDLFGNDTGVVIQTPMQWPLSKGFSFSCWVRVESFPKSGSMGLFNFFTESSKGCYAALSRNKLIYESINVKRQLVALDGALARQKWQYFCITHSIGRAFSGGSILRCYVDGKLSGSIKCRYPKVSEMLTDCKIGTKISVPPPNDEETSVSLDNDPSSFVGQIGPLYMFNDALSSAQVHDIYSLGPNYMYSFLDREVSLYFGGPVNAEILDSKAFLASKVSFGLSAQASDGINLFNVSPMPDHVSADKGSFKAAVLPGTRLCSRCLLQHILYCVGGVSVFFPLFTLSDGIRNTASGLFGQSSHSFTDKEHLTATIIEIIASVLDENLSNQQQMHFFSGFHMLGFLLKSVPPPHLNLEMISALKRLFSVIAKNGLSEVMEVDFISNIFFNPLVWSNAPYKVQREVYMFLIQQLDSDPRLLKSLCRFPDIMDLIQQFYWDVPNSKSVVTAKTVLHSQNKDCAVAERPSNVEIRKIRLLLLSLGEMSLGQSITAPDMRALITFFETSGDMACIEDVLHMVIRVVSQKHLVIAFIEQLNSISGCHLFLNLLQRKHEPIRLLSLQFIGRLLVGLPPEKKGSRFFNISVGKASSERKSTLPIQTIVHAMSDRLFQYPQSDFLCAVLFDVLLGGASPKQVLQKQNPAEKPKNKGNSSHFFLPQTLILIFRLLCSCKDASFRIKIIRDLLDLLDSNSSNIEALMENGWSAWLLASSEFDMLKSYKLESQVGGTHLGTEIQLIIDVYSTVLCHYIKSVKGGWQNVEDTANFLLERGVDGSLYPDFLRDLYKDMVKKLVDSSSSDDNIFLTQPCRDNTLYLLKLVDEILISEIDSKLPYPAGGSDWSLDSLELDVYKDIASNFSSTFEEEFDPSLSRERVVGLQPFMDDQVSDGWWTLYDNIWAIITELSGKRQNRTLPRPISSAGASFGQRARGLVESLNIPAAEMATVMVSGGIGVLGGKPNKNPDKAMLLRGEKCPRIVFRLLVFYLCSSSIERVSKCIQQVIPLLPYLLAADDEQSRSRLQLFIWSLISVRLQYGILDNGTRFHIISHLLQEAIICGKSVLVASIVGKDDSSNSTSFQKEAGALLNLIQKDRVVSAVVEEVNNMKMSKAEREKQLVEFRIKMEETKISELVQKRDFEGEMQSTLNGILGLDDFRRESCQLRRDEEQQTISDKWVHMFRTLTDERGPWSSNNFPNGAIRHWKLDKTEDMWRRRLKLRQNYQFDESLCHPPSTSDTFSPENNSNSRLGLPDPRKNGHLLLKGVHVVTSEGYVEGFSTVPDNCSSENEKKSSNENVLLDRKDQSATLDAENKEVLMNVPCVLITPKRKLAGNLAVMKNVLYFFGEFLVKGSCGYTFFNKYAMSTNFSDYLKSEKAGVVRRDFYKFPQNPGKDFEKLTSVDDTDAAQNGIGFRKLKKVKRHRRWDICKVKTVHWTRYLLRYTSIEVFFNDSTAPIFFNFPSQKTAKEVGSFIVSCRNDSINLKSSGRDKQSFVDRHVALELAETAQEKWQRRDITNFEYLMILNTLSGRSYNDLTQYPIFPWVLSDYSSDVLDFSKSTTFRDLSKPVGALDSKRFEVFEDRYRNFSDPDIPSFYYGSHYSSMGIVLFYLLRLEPYTNLHRHLQGGKFDHADRLFQSIDGAYKNCLSNTSDVKELIPEFFYMPEFLVNSNCYHLGVKQDGLTINDVCLPPWAKGSPEEFVSKNREALESEYVSSNLHHWIDLIFGFKQRGKHAIEAANLFYHLTYEGAVDVETVEDQLQMASIEDQIANFGQTPIQMFRKKHPRRGPPIPIAHPLHFAPASIVLTSILSNTVFSSSPLVHVALVDSNIVAVNRDFTLSVKTWLTTQLQSGGNLTFSTSQEPFFGIGPDILSAHNIGSPLSENAELGTPCFARVQAGSESFLVSCGTWQNTFHVISLSDGRTIQTVRQHRDVVSCVAAAADGSVLATGSHDTTVMVWEVPRPRTPDKRYRGGPVVVDAPSHILCGHDDIITCVSVSAELDLVVSGSRDGTCILHTLREGRYVRCLRHPSGSPLSKLALSRNGRLVMYADDDLSLHLYTANGKGMARSETNGRVCCMELTRCGDYLVCGGGQGQVVVRSMDSLEVVGRYAGVGKTVTALAVTPEECFLVGTRDGMLLLYSVENRHQQSRR